MENHAIVNVERINKILDFYWNKQLMDSQCYVAIRNELRKEVSDEQ